MIRSKHIFYEKVMVEEWLHSLPSYQQFIFETFNYKLKPTENGNKEIDSYECQDQEGLYDS